MDRCIPCGGREPSAGYIDKDSNRPIPATGKRQVKMEDRGKERSKKRKGAASGAMPDEVDIAEQKANIEKRKEKRVMRKMKKLLSILMAATMTLAMAAPAFAEGETGTITITNATKEQTYAAYKLFDANPSGEKYGDETDKKDLIAYTTTSTVQSWFERQMENPFTFTQVGTEDLYNVGLKEGVTDAAVTQFLQGLVVDSEGKMDISKPFFSQFTSAASAEATGKEVTLTVPYGYYMVTSSLGATVSVDYTNKNATILDKNQSGPSWKDDPEHPDHGKKIIAQGKTYATHSSANYGDTVDFQIKFETTNYHGKQEIYNYFVYDKLDAGFTYDKNTLKVTVGEKDVLSIEDDSYSVTWDADNQGFKVSIPWSTDKDSPSTITVEYSATVDTDAVIAGEGNKNKAWFTFKEKDPGTPNPGPEDPEIEVVDKVKETTTYVYALGINKTDAEGNGLSGATFELTDESGNPIKVTESTNDGEKGVYTYNIDQNATGDNKVTSPEGGLIVIKGLAEGTYTLTETVAPAGYNRLETAVTIKPEIEKTSTYQEVYHYTYVNGQITKVEQAGDGVTTVTSTGAPLVLENVINNRGALLPSTGGIGTTIFYAAGILLMAGAVFFIVRRKRA